MLLRYRAAAYPHWGQKQTPEIGSSMSVDWLKTEIRCLSEESATKPKRGVIVKIVLCQSPLAEGGDDAFEKGIF